MSDVAIRVNGLGKQYKIGASQKRHDTLRDLLVSAFRCGNGRGNDSHIWALKDVSFEVNHGEVVGVIGRNGAGKSTLLKILSRITEPTEGLADIYGRVGSLLEVGTGFHPELTGRENIYLNGAILGMHKAEIHRKFDEIVAFAEIEQFLDTQVKHYSSGMYVRLAFAVAAHLEPEILLVDEVLAVGDAAFQRKCLGKMGDVAKEGRTVLFVSHNMGAVQALCERSVLLEKGAITVSGPAHDVVSKYLGSFLEKRDDPFGDCVRSGNGQVKITSCHLESPQGEELHAATSGDPTVFVFDFVVQESELLGSVSFGFSISTDGEFGLCSYYSHFSDVTFRQLPRSGRVKCLLPRLLLSPGTYLLGCRVLVGGEEADWPRVRVPVKVNAGDFYRTGAVISTVFGPVLVSGEWGLEPSVGEQQSSISVTRPSWAQPTYDRALP